MAQLKWEIVAGVVPTGLVFDAASVDLFTTVAGVPTVAGVYPFTVRLTNEDNGKFFERDYTIEVFDNGSRLIIMQSKILQSVLVK